MSITVLIPTIAGREELRGRAVESVFRQDLSPRTLLVQFDHAREGAMETRRRALEKVTTEWVAFLDDDDELYEQHLRHCLDLAIQTQADVVYPWFDVPRGVDVLGMYGKPFDPERLDRQNYIPITALVRMDALRAAGGMQRHPKAPPPPDNQYEDWGTWLALRDNGAKFVHLPERTWMWRWHAGNTSGRPDK